MTTHYILTITGDSINVAFQLTYKAGKFSRLQWKRGKMATVKQWNWLMNLVPESETEINAKQERYSTYGVAYEVMSDNKPKSLHSKFMNAYTAFYATTTGMAPRINRVEGVALSSIIKHLLSLSNENEALEVWGAILANWKLLKPYYREKMELRHINSNLTNILRQLKDGQKADQEANKFRDLL